MTERSRFWDGSTTGDAVSITDDELMNRVFRALLNGTGDQGVLQGWLNELEVTDGGVDTATVDTGGAIVYGFWYENDAALDVDIAAYRGGNCLIVARASWAAATVRVVARAVGALTQTAGVTYEIPLANVAINGAGAITLVTDTRDYCEFSTEMLDGAVQTDSLVADAVTTAKLENQTRWITRGYGQFEPDATNPATAYAPGSTTYELPFRPMWGFSTGVSDTVWCTFRVPADISSATMDIYFWTISSSGYAKDVRWEFSSWDAQASAVLVNQTGAATVSYPDAWDPTISWLAIQSRYTQRDQIGSITVTAGDIVHMEIFRNGAHGDDTLGGEAYLFMMEAEYTADS